MSWIGGFRPSSSTKSDSAEAKKKTASELLEARNKKIQADRQLRAQQREKLKQQAQKAQAALEEAEQAWQELLAIEPDILDYPVVDIPENIIEDEIAIMAEAFDVENGEDGKTAMEKMGSIKCEFDKTDIDFWF